MQITPATAHDHTRKPQSTTVQLKPMVVPTRVVACFRCHSDWRQPSPPRVSYVRRILKNNFKQLFHVWLKITTFENTLCKFWLCFHQFCRLNGSYQQL
ncbi:hypothetical protein EG68_00445 [Paragonimus skrjabini miyazakii]|uniref:Uncharacterized protein n=1 Tax=Paragonimus skrjabini miyazakii TaxID=59628 RepID=A0A8S9Z5V1_9TREM|nr:hypothetical protein EG68_00445 [Paragonimus skrjabini miyazakii]